MHRSRAAILLCCSSVTSGSPPARLLRPPSLPTSLRPCPPTATPPPYKRAKLSASPPPPKPSGPTRAPFADEALGVWLLRHCPRTGSPVVRPAIPPCWARATSSSTRAVYDHATLKYDHHQRGYDERFAPKLKEGREVGRCTKLSASGLVYRHYGKEVISEHYPALTESASDLDWVYAKMYDSFMEAIDAIDTGVEPLPPAKDGEEEVQLQYKDSTGLSARVGRTNPRWNEVDDATGASPDPDARFEVASEMCGQDFLQVLTKLVEGDLPARSIVATAVKDRYGCDPSGEIIKLPSGGLPWKNQVYDLERELELEVPIKYVLYTDQAGMWRIQCVSVEGKAFENRLGLPSRVAGGGIRIWKKVAGIAGVPLPRERVHRGNKSYEGVEMARVALKGRKD
ncbi:hypothetical protein ACHAXT_005978 [Thalassiosira profunda]